MNEPVARNGGRTAGHGGLGDCSARAVRSASRPRSQDTNSPVMRFEPVLETGAREWLLVYDYAEFG